MQAMMLRATLQLAACPAAVSKYPQAEAYDRVSCRLMSHHCGKCYNHIRAGVTGSQKLPGI